MRRTLRRPAACATVLAALLASVAGAAIGKPPFGPMDVFGLEYAADPRISPDGSQVAYERHSFDVRDDAGRSAIWLVSTDGRRHRPLATGSFAESSPRWSPDGTRLAYIGTDVDGSRQIFVRYLDSGAVAHVTQVTGKPGEFEWSPDGRSLAFVMKAPLARRPLEVTLPQAPEGASWAEPLVAIDRIEFRADGRGFLPEAWSQLFVVPAEGGTPRQLTEGEFDHSGLAWSADGTEIIVSANRRADRDRHPLDTELHAVSVADGRLRTLTSRYGPDADAVVSPDGRRLAWVGFDDRRLGYHRRRLYVMNADGSGARELAPDLDRDLEDPAWSADGRRLYVKSASEGRIRLLEIDLDGTVRELATDLGGTYWSRPYTRQAAFSAARDGKLAFTGADPHRPSDITLLRRGRKPATLTNLNGELLGHRELGALEEFWFESAADGRRIQGWIVKPPGFDESRSYPMILEIHGGPFSSYGPVFAAEIQLYAAAGYVVLYVNPRGSTSYGEEFANLIHHAYPGQDYDDLMSGVDALLERGYVDPDRLYVTGGSGGGTLSAWIVGMTDRFRAAAVQKPVINWTSFSLTADRAVFFPRYWFPAMPWERPEEYWRRSPLSLAGNVSTPTLLVTGEEDYRTPIAEAEQLYMALKLRGIDTLLLRVPGAPHSLDQRPSQLIARTQYILAWFGKHGGMSGEP